MANLCPNCGNANPDDYAFCDECGARLTPGAGSSTTVSETTTTTTTAAAPMGGGGGLVRCPACGAENVAGAAFCDECGASLTDAPALSGYSSTQTSVDSGADA